MLNIRTKKILEQKINLEQKTFPEKRKSNICEFVIDINDGCFSSLSWEIIPLEK